MIAVEGMRHLSDEEIASIFVNIKKPQGVSKKLYSDVLNNITKSRIAEIRGIEDDPMIIEQLFEQEIMIEENRNMNSLILTDIDRRKYLSNRIGPTPKYYKEDEIQTIIFDWTKRIQEEINETFGVELIQEPDEERMLTEAEIKEIIKCVNYESIYMSKQTGVKIDSDIATYSKQLIAIQLRSQLDKVRIRPDRIDRLRELICDKFKRAIAIPGKWVGNIAAASFGEAATQQSLNTFHFAGDRGARKQITGFSRFKSIIDVSSNAQNLGMTIFMKERYSGEKMRLKIPNLQMTLMKEIIQDYRIIEVTEDTPVPRWEQVHNQIYGIGFSRTEKSRRLNIMRPSVGTGRILEITFNRQELFFRRISLNQIARAIEQINRKIRVVTSNMSIGIIYIYYHNFTNIVAESNVKHDIPAFALEDPFTFFLTKVLYPQIIELQVGGVWGIKYLYVKSRKIHKSIDKPRCGIEIKTENKRMFIAFIEEDIYKWALSKRLIEEFIGTRFYRFKKDPKYDMGIEYDENTFTVGFNTSGLAWRDHEDNQLKPFNKKIILEELERDSRIPLYDLLNFSSSTANPVRVDEVNPTSVRIEFNSDLLDELGYVISTIALTLENTFKSSSAISENVVTLTNLDIEKVAVGQILEQMKEILEVSDKLEQESVKWYYDVDGTNLQEVLAHPEVDSIHTRTSDIIETFRILGVESCRSLLIDEIALNVSKNMNPIHIELLADSLTFRPRGDKPLAQDRHGLRYRNAEFLLRAGFETTTNVLMEAGLGQTDNLESLPSMIMLGSLKTAGGLTETDRRIILTDPAFRFDRPDLQPNESLPGEEPIETADIIQTDTINIKPEEHIVKPEITAGILLKGRRRRRRR